MDATSSDGDPEVHQVGEFGVLAFRTVDRLQHGVMLTLHISEDEILYLTFTAEQARVLKDEIEKVIPIANRRDA